MSSVFDSTPGPAWLFCPADRPERFQKASAAADVVILDLEDGVAPADKDAARRALAATPLDPARTVVRINSSGSGEQEADLAALDGTPYTVVMLAKSESVQQVSALAPRPVIALVETPLGVLNAVELARADGTAGMMWGAEDLIAGLGGGSSRRPDRTYRDVAVHARSTVLLAGRSHGRFVLDSVHLDIRDVDGLAAAAEDAAAVGFGGTACIHPTQIAVVRGSFAPRPEDVAWARRVLQAAKRERGVFQLDGRMVDGPILKHAEAVLARAGD